MSLVYNGGISKNETVTLNRRYDAEKVLIPMLLDAFESLEMNILSIEQVMQATGLSLERVQELAGSVGIKQ